MARMEVSRYRIRLTCLDVLVGCVADASLICVHGLSAQCRPCRRWRRHVTPKRQFIINLHVTTSQKKACSNIIFWGSQSPDPMLSGVPVPTAWRVTGCGWRNGLQLWRVAANIWNKQPRTNDKECTSSLGLGVGLTTLHRKINLLRTWKEINFFSNRWRALVNSLLILRVLCNAGKLSSGLTYSGLSSSAQLHTVS
jgi:hypothetical protein